MKPKAVVTKLPTKPAAVPRPTSKAVAPRPKFLVVKPRPKAVAPKPILKPLVKPKPRTIAKPAPTISRSTSIRKTEASIVGEKKEIAVVFDSKGKELLRKTGAHNSVNFSVEETKKLRGTTVVHNHPSRKSKQFKGTTIENLPLSGADGFLLERHGLAEVRAVTKDFRYVIKPRSGAKLARARKIEDAWTRRERFHYQKETTRLSKLVEEGKISKVNAGKQVFLFQTESQHRAWVDIADDMGIAYTRRK